MSHEDITQNLFAFGHVPHDAIVWEPPTVEMLVEISRNSKGGEAASVDGWKADELKHVPPKAWECFRVLALTCGKSMVGSLLLFSTPGWLICPRNPMLVLSGIVDFRKHQTHHYSFLFWRVWAGAYVKYPFVLKWLAPLPEEIVAGKGADAQLAASELFGEMHNYKFGASMDYAKAYDCMSAPATCALLETGGWCPNFCKVILGAWGAQCRWVSWAGHTGGSPLLSCSCVPQGCFWGLSPCVLGCVAVSTGSVLKLPLVLRASLWTTVLFCLNRATGFCVRLRAGKTSRLWLGSGRSPHKIQLTSTTSYGRKALSSKFVRSERVSQEFTILGVSAAWGRRALTSKEADPFAVALSTAT